MSDPKCIICNQDAEMCSPADLCEQHWDDWFNYEKDWRCRKDMFVSRACERGTHGCTTEHDSNMRPDEER